MYPDDLRYTGEHEWARAEGDRATVGITHYAQDALGDIVYVDIPPAGTAVTRARTASSSSAVARFLVIRMINVNTSRCDRSYSA